MIRLLTASSFKKGYSTEWLLPLVNLGTKISFSFSANLFFQCSITAFALDAYGYSCYSPSDSTSSYVGITVAVVF